MKLIECPRDAIQGFNRHIPTEKKIEYFNKHKKKDDLADAFLQAIYYIDFNKL